MKHSPEFMKGALRHGIAVRPKASKVPAPQAVILASVMEFLNLGYQVSPEALTGMNTGSLEALLAQARSTMGADRQVVPVYPGFPEQVESLDTLTLLVEQLMHYWTAGDFLPSYPTVAREGLDLEDMVRSTKPLEVLESREAAKALLTKLVQAPRALSEGDRTLVMEALQVLPYQMQGVHAIASSAKNAENFQTLVLACVAKRPSESLAILEWLLPLCKTPDMLLRTLLATSTEPSAPQHQENYTLVVKTLADRHAPAVKFLTLPKGLRRQVVARLGEVTPGYKADRLVETKTLWRRAMRSFHPYSLGALTPESKRALDIIHANVEYKTLNSSLEAYLAAGDGERATNLMREHAPGLLLTKLVTLLRISGGKKAAQALALAVEEVGPRAKLSTLISAYNGILSANDLHTRVTRTAGVNNSLVARSETSVIPEKARKLVLKAVKSALVAKLAQGPAPTGVVGTQGPEAVSLITRDLSTGDRVLERGSRMAPVGSGDVLRIFGLFTNNQNASGYMDIGVTLLDETCTLLGTCTWSSWAQARAWATYSGDTLVKPGRSAAEYVDLKLPQVAKHHPTARYAAMTVQSYSGWPMNEVDFLAGAMFRKGTGRKGQVFDARSVATAFKPTTAALQSVPLVVDLKTGDLIWLDSSSGSTSAGVSSEHDQAVGPVVYDELLRPKLTFGKLAKLWAKAHGAETSSDLPVDQEALLGLLS